MNDSFLGKIKLATKMHTNLTSVQLSFSHAYYYIIALQNVMILSCIILLV